MKITFQALIRALHDEFPYAVVEIGTSDKLAFISIDRGYAFGDCTYDFDKQETSSLDSTWLKAINKRLEKQEITQIRDDAKEDLFSEEKYNKEKNLLS